MRVSLLLFAICFSFSSFAQNNISVTKDKTNGFDEKLLREKMKNDGLPQPVIDKLIAQRKELFAKGKNVEWTKVKKNSVTNAACSDMGAENGWGTWLGDVGNANSGAPPTWTPPAALPATPNFSITTGSGFDANTPGPNAGDPTIPFVCPGFGNASIQLGETCVAGCVAEQLTYPLTITLADTNFLYAYAIVIEDAGHAPSDQPFVNFSLYDQSGNLVPQCANFTYTGGPSIPGFYSVSGTGCGWAGADQYKPWTIVGVNLTPYIGTTVTAVITNVDCAQCGHWAYSYWDFLCGSIPLSSCSGSQSTICGPIDPNISYTYQWYQNGNAMPPPTGTQQCISIVPNSGDSFLVEVQQPSGCNFHMSYVASGSPMQALFTYIANGNTITFTNLSNGASSYVWNFGDGNTSTAQNPVYTYSAIGTYTVCLVASTFGCSDTVCKVISLTPIAVNEYDLFSSVSIFPNPVSGNLFLDFGNINFGKAEVSFSDIIGQTLFETTIPASGKQALDVSGFLKGLYFLKLKTDSGSVTKKIVIAR
ncbi:MAG: T9SS type A sorting domain-containing protein [Bacteroidetes bacterium]|nr:T9SS type A sorting domain-containing protein [Bacteroidota bacterium]